jgi:hypothetical protein
MRRTKKNYCETLIFLVIKKTTKPAARPELKFFIIKALFFVFVHFFFIVVLFFYGYEHSLKGNSSIKATHIHIAEEKKNVFFSELDI